MDSLFYQKKKETPGKKWITITYCHMCEHRVGSKKIHANLHRLEKQNFDISGPHNSVIGRYLETFDNIGYMEFEWKELDDAGSIVTGTKKFDWESMTAITSIDREIRNILRPSESDVKDSENIEKQREHRNYYSASARFAKDALENE